MWNIEYGICGESTLCALAPHLRELKMSESGGGITLLPQLDILYLTPYGDSQGVLVGSA